MSYVDGIVLDQMAEFAGALSERPALICGGRSLDWRSLDQKSNQIAHGLLSLGLKKGDRAAILSDTMIEYYLCVVGAAKAGISIVPFPTMTSPDALAGMLSDSEAKIVFSCATRKDVIDNLYAENPALAKCHLFSFDYDVGRDEEDGWRSFEGWFHQFSADRPTVKILPEDEFNIIYSSGTTGTPKGIVHSNAFRSGDAVSMAGAGFFQEAVTVITTALYSNFSLYAFLAALQTGGTAVVLPKFSTQACLELCEKIQPDNIFLVPVQCERLLADAAFGDFDLGTRTKKWVAGSPMTAKLKLAILGRWPGELVEMYGMTEGTPSSSLAVHNHPDKLDSVGRPSDGCIIRILDENDADVHVGDVGEIVGRGPAMMSNYNNRPDLMNDLEWFDASGARYFRSGDLGYLDKDGFLYITGRKKDMIISGGFNVYPKDLEDVLCTHPAVEETAVVGVFSEIWGETPVGFVVLHANAELELNDLLSWANERLGKMQRLDAVLSIDALPRGALGKVLKKDLRAGYDKVTTGKIYDKTAG